MKKTSLGLLLGFATYVLWGFFPLYWKSLGGIDSYVVLSYRILWTCVTMVGYMVLSRSTFRYVLELNQLFLSKKNFTSMIVAGILIALNWLIYISAVSSGKATEASLGYYIMPLLSILLAFFFLKEKLDKWMFLSICLATCGVGIFVLEGKEFPRISLMLAITFSLYGLIKKKMHLSSDVAMLVEALAVLPFALIYLMFFAMQSLLDLTLVQNILLSLSGMITAIPLLLFAEAVKRAPYGMIGFLQYINPTIQLLLAVFLFGERLESERLYGFAFIWLAIGIFIFRQIRDLKKIKKPLNR